MATPIQMPSLSPTMTEGKIVKWLKKVGDKVSSGEALAELETDKSNLEIEAYDDGYLLQILVGEDQSAPVGAPIAYIGAQGEKVAAGGAPAPKAAAPASAPTPAPAAKVEAPVAPAAAPATGGGRIAIQLPSLSPTMTEGKIVKWLKKVGDKVSSGEALAELETDKSNLEIEAYDDGTLAEIVVGENQSAPVGSPIAYLTPKGGKAAAAPTPAAVPKPVEAAAPRPPAPAAQATPAASAPVASGGRRVRASPLAKKIAKDRGLDIAQVQGSGPSGRVVKRDIEEALARGVKAPAAAPSAPAARKAPSAATVARPEARSEPLSSMRKVIAQRMTEVKPGVPHFYLTLEVEMDAAVKVREEAKAMELKVSVNDLIVKAVAMAVRRYPKINVSLQGDQVVHHGSVDVGIAVALEQGLITPVIRDADTKGLQAISTEVRELAERARKRALKPEEYTGGSITVSNLGMYGIDQFVAIINPPQASILAVGAVADKVVARDGQMVIRKMMTATLSCDHRIIDGAIGAEFLRELRGLLEHPTRLLF
ncbi:pyruvate dehydrogenase complex dihydrolipoamide acetyltransferase [Myxococcus sp. CA056]|uniref:pyruvate dehydrogenase complex dihydrolipoamide acetyltransferase n=1 Tax=unclassified Myxococcus TaxID=2648731 RepID=UPI00157B1BE7|nr:MULTISPECIES: pyruvate dehydrogenase complex dihydrolipoamide acetyltransferase [unclassified Myxococcus]NTX13351.1 pyruvate dehydrogenase complex dihydrolipoamide acetyltransferase [Myxococcus sp. CA056]NTX35789.1 pyruvate dehydrogenase complex dihydrolipoamide acetyltransferase [Myxococcus sp. CA033]NTX52691.1 pyruvate dehydrogenase complex dihydrolipoamide acetyltransferase [Myxococcus sp. CA039A]